jgi:hypothetical protein
VLKADKRDHQIATLRRVQAINTSKGFWETFQKEKGVYGKELTGN